MTEGHLGWYFRRLCGMSPNEVTWRIADKARQVAWRRHQVRAPAGVVVSNGTQLDRPPRFDATMPQGAAQLIPAAEVTAIVAQADRLLRGSWEVLGVTRKDMDAPDWFLDPISGKRAPHTDYCFSINYRSEAVAGNVKQVWEPSRLQHVTVLACAFAVSGSECYAEAAAAQLRSWWKENPFLSGVHWTSGIELGLRLISWVWTRRLLEGWPGVEGLFEGNEEALAQIWWHQTYLDAFRSRGSSANNHVIAEAAGQVIAALAFPWFRESGRWADRSGELLQRELAKNTFPSGVNREMAFEYHGFVAELGLAAVAEGERAGKPLADVTKESLCRMLDVVAACADERTGLPRYGDSDDGRAFLLGDPTANRWSTLLSIGAGLFGAPAWWPPRPPDAASALLVALAGGKVSAVDHRPASRPDAFDDAGLVILRTSMAQRPEIWCRCDSGPHGFLSIAAHAHADALSVEVRHGGIEVLADPGTYCYHGDDRWRSYFRSTLAHNTVEVAGRDQSTSGGPFLWTRHARTTGTPVTSEGASIESWSAEHDGYRTLDPPVRHRRNVQLDRAAGRVEITDQVESSGDHSLRAAFHLGPTIEATLSGHVASLSWVTFEGRRASATLELPDGMAWSSIRGAVDPPLGWYSSGFGKKVPSTTLLGVGSSGQLNRLTTLLTFHS